VGYGNCVKTVNKSLHVVSWCGSKLLILFSYIVGIVVALVNVQVFFIFM